MCAVIGIIMKAPTREDFSLVRKVFVESSIRGLHATGISYILDDKVVTVKEPIPAREFVDSYLTDSSMETMVTDDGFLYMIGHCRYSTSDLEFNQPISNDTKSIVHNGVITQELPENWQRLYGHNCMTKNDSEFVLLSKDPLREYAHMSMSVCELTSDRNLRFYRNGKRPLYFHQNDNGCIITSTADIAQRCNIEPAEKTEAFCYYSVDKSLTIRHETVETSEFDYQ